MTDRITELATQLVNNNEIILLNAFTDDHILCAEVQIGGVNTNMFWIDWQGCAALRYMNESETAKQDVIQLVRDQIISTCHDILEACMEDDNQMNNLDEYDEGLILRRSVYRLDGLTVSELKAITEL